jgi:hypothetical protein
MDSATLKFTAIPLAGLLLFAGSVGAQTPSANTMPDAQVEANVLKALSGTRELANESITTNTVYGTVTLTGSVKDEATRQMAENVAARAAGVKKVVDQLSIGAPTSPGLQADGTTAHAPDPDTYAAQHGMNGGPDQPEQSQGPGQPPMEGNRPPYPGPYDGQSGPRQPGPQAGNDDSQQPPRPLYPPNGRPYRQAPQPPPYGAQVGGQAVTVPSGSMLRIRINEGLDTRHTQPGTAFDAVVLNDVVADGAVAIPRGAAVQGKVTESKSGGVLAGRGQIALQLTQVTLGGKTFPLVSDVWTRDGAGKGGETAGSAIGLGATGAVIGAIVGGGAGAGIGALAGGAAGVGASAANGRREVLIPSEAILTFHLAQAAPLTTVSQAEMDRLGYGVPVGSQQQGPPMVRRRYFPQPYYGPVYYPRPYPYPY